MSVFSEIPATEWIVSNRSAFAIFDRFPVAEGHALVIPRREISTWWDAVADERSDLLLLVDQVKALLDDRFGPDGYNVGFNSGPAAGQTVDHLHIHVIPRRVGDMADPRGGVRHVIPERGNYLSAEAPAAGPSAVELPPGEPQSGAGLATLVDGADGRVLKLEMLRCFMNPEFDRIDLLVSFVMKSGLRLLDAKIEEAIGRGSKVRVLTTDYMNVTDADALARLLDLAEESAELDGSLEVRVFSDPLTSFHPKAYLFWSSVAPEAAAFVGSNNLSKSGIDGGVEWSLGVSSVAPLVASFEDLWTDRRSHVLDHERLREYRRLWQPTAGEPIAVGVATEAAVEAPQPRAIQAEALAALEATREVGHQAGLVVMATGLGKTWLAAFDTTRPEFGRTLFVAHREEILRQSRDVFRRVRPSAELGLYYGLEKVPDADVVFASVQTLARRLGEFDTTAFDYVVVDEFHHASASSYRKVIDHFRPRFLMGLTATPERLDSADLLALCGDNLVFDCGLVEGIDRSELVPFHYWGIKDVTDFEPIPWRNGRFDPEELTRAVETHDRAQQAFQEWQQRCGARTIGFCASMSHADFMAAFFRDRGIAAVAVHSGPTSASRHDSVEDLRTGALEVLFAVDIFNEGVDIPEIDSVMMLRPTESPIVFLQQLGRGLRINEGKDHLNVVDFVGNHASFLLKPRVLLSLGVATHPTNRQLVESLAEGEFELPAGCSVNFDLEAIDLLSRLASAGKPAGQRTGLEEFCLDYASDTGMRPTAAQAHRSGYNPRAGRSKDGHWFATLDSLGLLDDDEVSVVGANGEVLRRFETEQVTKSYKLVTLRAMLADGILRTGGDVSAIAERSRRLVLADPRLVADVRTKEIPDPAAATDAQWEAHWRKWPTAHLAGDKATGALFRLDGDRLVPNFTVAEASGDAFDAMVAELVEWRLADYLLRSDAVATGSVPCRVIHASGKPIISLDRAKNPQLPEGDVPLMVDGVRHVARFVKIAVNVVHAEDSEANELAGILRGWFGPSAGHPGTQHAVLLDQTDGGWSMRPELVDADAGLAVPYYPSFAVACGAFAEAESGASPVAADSIELELRGGSSGSVAPNPSTHFVAVARGDSMAGGADPIRHGDPLLFEWARGVGRADLVGERVLVQMSPGDGSTAVLKELRRDGGGWQLVSAAPGLAPIDGTSDMRIVARMVRRLEQAEVNPLAKFIGERFKRQHVPALFGLTYNPGNWQTGHVSLGKDVVLFVTLTKHESMAAGSDYVDHFESPDLFVWSSQTSVGPDAKKGREILDALDNGTRVHLFARAKKSDVAFAYCGLVAPIDHTGAKPMSVRFHVLDPLSTSRASALGCEFA